MRINNKKKNSEDRGNWTTHSEDRDSLLSKIPLPLEIRVHGRGGQGGVTCAKLCASVYSRLGLFAQTFGDYGMERAGAPVRAYTRIDRQPIKNRNKVYSPGHLLILDCSLLELGVTEGAPTGSLVLLNTGENLKAFRGLYEQFRLATVNATEIARKHGIGTSAVVIVNTALVGAYARVVDLPIGIVRETFSSLGLHNDIPAAQDAYDSVTVREISKLDAVSTPPSGIRLKAHAEVTALTDHTSDMPTPLKTGAWRTQSPYYVTLQAPCNGACPAGNDIVGFIQKLEQKGVDAAVEVLSKTQPLPSVCGRVCAAPCMETCNRASHDRSVNIRGLERWMGDHATNFSFKVDYCANPRKVAVVGGGPAGLSAAFSITKAGHYVEIYESQTKLGGLLRNAIPSYRLPEEALDRDIDRILALGVRLRVQETLTSQRVQELAQEYDAVVVATGQSHSRDPGFSGIDYAGVEQGLTFLNRVKAQGGERMQGTVVVIGGGNTALDCAGTAMRCGAAKVYIIYRRGRFEMPAIEEEIEDILAEGVELVLHRQPMRIIGNDRVTAIELAEVELGDPDESGRKRPLATNRLNVIPCDHVLLAVGQSSNLGILPSDWAVKGHRVSLYEQPLNVWLAGDLTSSEGSVAHAIGHGRKVATNVLNFFEERACSCTDFPGSIPKVVTADTIRFSYFPIKDPHHDRRIEVSSRVASFREVNQGLPNAEESQRCLSCGHCTQCDTCLIYCPEGIISRRADEYVINSDYCKGCGICVWECPRHAMSMSAEGYRSRP